MRYFYQYWDGNCLWLLFLWLLFLCVGWWICPTACHFLFSISCFQCRRLSSMSVYLLQALQCLDNKSKRTVLCHTARNAMLKKQLDDWFYPCLRVGLHFFSFLLLTLVQPKLMRLQLSEWDKSGGYIHPDRNMQVHSLSFSWARE